MKLLLSHQVIQSINVSNVVLFSKWVAKSLPEYICVITRFIPSPTVKDIPVFVLMACPTLYEEISQNNEYAFIHAALAVHDTVNHAAYVKADIPKRFHVYLVIVDQMYLAALKSHPVVSVVHE
jgi:hypothetical protein